MFFTSLDLKRSGCTAAVIQRLLGGSLIRGFSWTKRAGAYPNHQLTHNLLITEHTSEILPRFWNGRIEPISNQGACCIPFNTAEAETFLGKQPIQ